MSKKELYIDIFKITYLSLIYGLISDTLYIDILQKLTINGFKTYHIDDFERLILYMYNTGIVNSFNISVLIHYRDICYKTLSDISKNFDDIRTIFSVKKKKMILRIENISNILKNKRNVLKSFRKNDRYDSINMVLSNSSDNKKRYLSNDIIQKYWDYYTRLDIMDRLYILVDKHYKLNELSYMGVNLQLTSHLNRFTCFELENYYIKTISIIETKLRDWILTCRMYIDIEINYLECCKNIIAHNNCILSLKNFYINISD